MAVTESIGAAPAEQPGVVADPGEARLQRHLKIVIAVLALLLIGGLATVIGRIIYLASVPSAQPQATVETGAAQPSFSVQLPAGAEVRSISVSGDRLAVHYQAAGGEGIAILDLRTGRPAASIGIERAAPAN